MIETSAYTVKELKAMADSLPADECGELIKNMYADSREGVKKLALELNRKKDRSAREALRIDNLKRIELGYYADGKKYVAGCDEAGRGPLCGPVVSAVVIMPPESRIPRVNDSKKLTEKTREELYARITAEAVAWSVGAVDNETVDKINILQATKQSVRQALADITLKPDMLLTDALYIGGISIPQKSFIKGDANLYCIAAASIIAKVTRDRLMYEYDRQYPQYGFAANKGYGTEEHMQALKKYGPTPIHRRTFIHGITEHTHAFVGRSGEKAAAEYLRGKGYEIITANFKRADGEIDIIAAKDGITVFAEVKARGDSSFGKPEECVNIEKQRRIVKTANRYMLEHGLFSGVRFDIVAVDIRPEGGYAIRHYENAFTAE